MDARRRRPRIVLSLLGACALASSVGCNPFGWGISNIKSLIHHHAYRPVDSERDRGPANSPVPPQTASGEFSTRPA
ncbi:MAG TPA: hypothetical protein VHB99_14185 [Pirellulales bacterium]|nr:hypothetical protein [Pirellulales bacterium]